MPPANETTFSELYKQYSQTPGPNNNYDTVGSLPSIERRRVDIHEIMKTNQPNLKRKFVNPSFVSAQRLPIIVPSPQVMNRNSAVEQETNYLRFSQQGNTL